MASFCVFLYGKARKSEECGIHLVYASHAHEHNSASAGKSLIPTITIRGECKQDEQSGSQLNLCAHGEAINKLKTFECSLQPDSFCMQGCKNIRSLPSELSLTPLICLGCSGLRSFLETLEDMENLKELHLDGTVIEELPASIQHL